MFYTGHIKFHYLQYRNELNGQTQQRKLTGTFHYQNNNHAVYSMEKPPIFILITVLEAVYEITNNILYIHYLPI